MEKGKGAFDWIVAILRKNAVDFHVTGGLAAKAYGSNRPLADIDIEVNNTDLNLIFEKVKTYAVFGPKRYVDANFSIDLLTLEYKGQLIDISGINHQKLFSRKSKKWIVHSNKLSKSDKKKVFGRLVKVIALRDLLHYKSIIARKVDVEDIRQIGLRNSV